MIDQSDTQERAAALPALAVPPAEPPSLPFWHPPTLTVLDVTVTAGGVVNDVESNGGIWTS